MPPPPAPQLACRPRDYHRREPERTALYATLQEHLQTFLAEARLHEKTLPRFVERELHAFLRCGILAHGTEQLIERVMPEVPVRQRVLKSCPEIGSERARPEEKPEEYSCISRIFLRT